MNILELKTGENSCFCVTERCICLPTWEWNSPVCQWSTGCSSPRLFSDSGCFGEHKTMMEEALTPAGPNKKQEELRLMTGKTHKPEKIKGHVKTLCTKMKLNAPLLQYMCFGISNIFYSWLFRRTVSMGNYAILSLSHSQEGSLEVTQLNIITSREGIFQKVVLLWETRKFSHWKKLLAHHNKVEIKNSSL